MCAQFLFRDYDAGVIRRVDAYLDSLLDPIDGSIQCPSVVFWTPCASKQNAAAQNVTAMRNRRLSLIIGSPSKRCQGEN